MPFLICRLFLESASRCLRREVNVPREFRISKDHLRYVEEFELVTRKRVLFADHLKVRNLPDRWRQVGNRCLPILKILLASPFQRLLNPNERIRLNIVRASDPTD